MARPKKKSIDYFSMETNFFEQREIKKLLNFAPEAALFYLKLKTEIFKNSFYQFFEDDDFEWIAKELNIVGSYIEKYLNKLFDLNLLNREIFETYGILTSLDIYEEYVTIKKSSKSNIQFNEFENKIIEILQTSSSEFFPKSKRKNQELTRSFSELTQKKSENNSEKKAKNDGIDSEKPQSKDEISTKKNEFFTEENRKNPENGRNGSRITQNFPPINKIKENKIKGEENKKEKKEIPPIFPELISLFSGKNNSEEKIDVWLKTYQELRKELTDQEILEIVKFGKSDEFWKQNFFDFSYLTHKSRTDGVPIWQKINAQVKAQNSVPKTQNPQSVNTNVEII